MGAVDLAALRAAIAGHRDEMVALLQALVRIPSVGGSDAENDIQVVLAGRFSGAGLEVDHWAIDLDATLVAPDAPGVEVARAAAHGLVARLPGADPDPSAAFMVNSHVDVVPPGDLRAWGRDPFAGEWADGSVHGRGACDMKGGLVAGFWAVSAIRAMGRQPPADVLLACVQGEEDGGLGTYALLDRGWTAAACVVPEPTGLDIVPANAGALTFRLRVPGQATHASRRLEGVSAIEKFVPVLRALEALEARRNREPDPLVAVWDLPYPLSIGTVAAGDWPSSVPDLLTAEGRLGVALDEPVADARTALEDALADACAADPWLRDHPVTVEWWGGQFASGRLPAGSGLVERVAGAHVTATDGGAAPAVWGAPYGSDLRLLVGKGGIPTVQYGPGDAALAHSPHEHVRLADVETVATTLALLALGHPPRTGARTAPAGSAGLSPRRAVAPPGCRPAGLSPRRAVAPPALLPRSLDAVPWTGVKTLDDAPYLDIFSEAFVDDPVSVTDDVRARSWLARTPIGGIVLGREQVQVLIADRRLRNSVPDIVRMQGVTEGVLHDEISRSIIALEGEDHARLRRLVSRAFTPRATDVHRPEMRAVLEPLVAPLRGAGHCEFMTAVADHYPIEVMCHVLGVPAEDHDDFASWGRAITWSLSFHLGDHVDEVNWGLAKMSEYVVALIADRRREPQEDMVTALVQASEDDDHLSDDEVFSLIASLLFAGYDTTRNQLGLAVWLFATFPEQWAQLRADPTLAPSAVEEVMRFRGAVGAAPRFVVEPIELDGYRLEPGTMLTLSTASANHDPSAYEDPWTFDITVERAPHFTFGGGPHYCLGASLARAEMQEALPVLAEAMPGLALDGEPEWRLPFGIFGPESLPLRYG